MSFFEGKKHIYGVCVYIYMYITYTHTHKFTCAFFVNMVK